jgi:hypothetical protein
LELFRVFRVIVAILLLTCCGCCLVYKFFRSAFDRFLPSSSHPRDGYVDDNKYNEYPQSRASSRALPVSSAYSVSTTRRLSAPTELPDERLPARAAARRLSLATACRVSAAGHVSATGISAATTALLIRHVKWIIFEFAFVHFLAEK